MKRQAQLFLNASLITLGITLIAPIAQAISLEIADEAIAAVNKALLK